MAWLATETCINIGAVVGVLPVTGIPLPFISYGGSSLVITMVAAGILINIARQEDISGPHGIIPHGMTRTARHGHGRRANPAASTRGRGR